MIKGCQPMANVITYGTFDFFHNGHRRILERARDLCSKGGKLFVGVTSENYDRERGKLNVVQSLTERMNQVRECGLADEVFVEEYEGQKIDDLQRYAIDMFVIGDDWLGKFDYLKDEGIVIKKAEVYRKALFTEISHGAWARLYKKEVFHDLRFPVGIKHEDTYIIIIYIYKIIKILFYLKILICKI